VALAIPLQEKRAVYIDNALSGNYLHQAGTKNGAQGTPIGIVRHTSWLQPPLYATRCNRPLVPVPTRPKMLIPPEPRVCCTRSPRLSLLILNQSGSNSLLCQPNLHLFRMSSQIPGPSKSGKAPLCTETPAELLLR
jgi:hypothetical protein